MTTFAILATGPSMSQAVAESVRGRCKVIAVSDAYKLAPWADVLVSSDRGWWRLHAPEFAGEKVSGVPVDGVPRAQDVVSGSNSGLIAVQEAVRRGATKILMLGFDMHGTHYFGEHPKPLRNTSKDRFEVFKRQFHHYQPKGVDILNCTEGSALTCYPMARLGDHLESMAKPASPDCGKDGGIQGRAPAPGVRRRARLHARPRRAGRDDLVEPDTRRSSRGEGV